MSKRLVLLLLLVFAPGVYAEALVIEPKHAYFDVATAFSTVGHDYTVANHSDKIVKIRDWKAIAGIGTVEGLPSELAPGASHAFRVKLPLPGRLGTTRHRFALFTDEADVERYRFTLTGFVMSIISPARPVADFGSFKDGTAPEQRVAMSAMERTPLALTSIVSQPDWLEARIEGTAVVLRAKRAAALGIHGGTVRVATNLPAQPFVEIVAKAVIEGDLRPAVYALGIRPTPVGQVARASLELAYSGKGDLDRLAVEAPAGWKIVRSACSSPTPGATCARVALSRTLTEPGRSDGILRLRLPGETPLEIPFGAMTLGAEQPMRELVVGDKTSDDDSSAPADLAAALRNITAPAAAPVAPAELGKKVNRSEGAGPARLNWTAKNDARLFGYLVYRSEQRAGPFQRVSDRPVMRDARADAGAAATYTFVDAGVQAGRTYYYYIDTLGNDGVQERFSPILTKKVSAAP